VRLAEILLDGFGLETETVEPDVVLGQADVDVEGLVFFGAGEEGLNDCCGSYETGLVVGVGCGDVSGRSGTKGLYNLRNKGRTASSRPKNLPWRWEIPTKQSLTCCQPER
jgi:hypothetical protein